jgi:hypothetical protein
MRDVASQFRRFSAVRSSFVREELTVTGNEVMDQSAVMDVTIFGLSIAAGAFIAVGAFIAEANIHRLVVFEIRQQV